VKVGLHVNRKTSLTAFTLGYQKILQHNGIECVLLNVEQPGFWRELSGVDAFIYQAGHASDVLQLSASFLPIIQQHSIIPTFPNFDTFWHFDDKLKQHYLAEFFQLPFAKSWVFWSKDSALRWAGDAHYPLVFKLRGGAGSTNVILVKEPPMAKKLIKRAFSSGIADSTLPSSWRVKYLPLKKYIRNQLVMLYRALHKEDRTLYWQHSKNYAYFQSFLPGNEFDTRVSVIGQRAFAFRRFNRKEDFRASGSGKIDYARAAIDLDMVRIALETSQKLGFQCMSYDFLYDDKIPVICEISYTFQDLAVYKCPGYWDANLEWHEGNYMPQLFILNDLLNMELVQPRDWFEKDG